MKMILSHNLVFLCLMTLFATPCSGQDTLTLINGKTVIIKLKSYDLEKIVFSTAEDTAANIQLPVNRIDRLVLSTGIVIVGGFHSRTLEEVAQSTDSIALRQQAYADANRYYKDYKSAGTGTLLSTTFLTPAIGLFVAVSGATTPVRTNRLGAPDFNLRSNEIYMNAYKEAAFSKKKSRVWTNFAVGTVVFAGVAAMVISAQQSAADSVSDSGEEFYGILFGGVFGH